ncbi:coatomer protein complex subunit beta, putative [Eimeria brunetti]|uniref:Coatomer protein complex subunit beta, putative n=1 Tax=Eimeria brunetti TaxID=51314 RepID=U6LIU3_9EIME|nr:coatomer protein complex subunit beta, putative [Eimeria brunetti]
MGKANDGHCRPPEELPAYPSERSDAFPDWEAAKQAEAAARELYGRKMKATQQGKVQQLLEADILATIKEAGPDAVRV